MNIIYLIGSPRAALHVVGTIKGGNPTHSLCRVRVRAVDKSCAHASVI